MQDLRILCFGASLVEGFTRGGRRYTPFGKSMANKLQEKWPHMDLNVVVNGTSGDMVTGGFERRMEDAFSPKSLTPTPSPTPPYHYTIFLGGTNDLGYGKPPTEIYTAIKTITDIPLSHSSKVLLMTIPECAARSEALDANREAVNKAIRDDARANLYTFDLHAAMPYHSLQEAERREIWDDGLHFTPKGYERMGELIAVRLLEILESQVGEDDAGKKP